MDDPQMCALVTAGGAYLLAVFWANVLQHQLNYPAAQFTYSRHWMRTKDSEVLRLVLDDKGVRLSVDMSTGELAVSGHAAYNWFTTEFRRLLDNVDARFGREWVFEPTPTGELPLPRDDRICRPL